jgi:hypothetical protein
MLDLVITIRPRGGMVTQRIANPSIPVRFWAWPPNLYYYDTSVDLSF